MCLRGLGSKDTDRKMNRIWASLGGEDNGEHVWCVWVQPFVCP